MPRSKKDLTKTKSNSLTVTGPHPTKPRYWYAQCRDCETSKPYRDDLLIRGQARCQLCDSKRWKHGRTVGGQHDYVRALYDNIRRRIHTNDYAHILVPFYPLWAESFDVFARDVIAQLGERPGPEYSLDRVDGELGYQPHNIRWAVIETQNQNRKIVPRYQLAPGSRKTYTMAVGGHLAAIDRRLQMD